MNKRLKIHALLALTMLLVSLRMPSTAAGEYATVADIREETKNGWHETYTVDGRTVTVDIGIKIPDVDKVAAVRVALAQNIQLTVPENAKIVGNDETGFAYYVMNSEHPFIGGGDERHTAVLRLMEQGVRAENSPLSPKEAMELLLDIIEPYRPALEPFDLQLAQLSATTRRYVVKSSDSSGNTLDFHTPASDTGYYEVRFHQLFHGLPYLYTSPPFIFPVKPNTVEMTPRGEVTGHIATKDDYAVTFYPAAETGVVAEDIPLAPFSRVKAEFERLILEGYIREVYGLQLGYVALDDPDDLGGSFILVPVWELNCTIVEKPSFLSPDFSNEERARLKFFGAQEALVNAQTGVYYDPADKRPGRRYADIITWEQAR